MTGCKMPVVAFTGDISCMSTHIVWGGVIADDPCSVSRVPLTTSDTGISNGHPPATKSVCACVAQITQMTTPPKGIFSIWGIGIYCCNNLLTCTVAFLLPAV